MAKKASRRSAVKTLTLVKSRDIVVDKLLAPCEEDNHSKCTGWAVLKRELSPIDANYFLRCSCACHKKGAVAKKVKPKQKMLKKVKKKKQKRKPARRAKRTTRSKTSKRSRRK